jgi:3-phosphoshikimate 1-carboxyvinyltransferase
MNAIRLTPPTRLAAEIRLPASKSICNRVLAIKALGKDDGLLPDSVAAGCDDTRVMLEWLRTRPATVDIGAAGTAMRFSTALLAVSEGSHTITGSERMRHRPIRPLVDALRTLGADITYAGEDGFPPLHIAGRPSLPGGYVEIEGGVSSQYISALLMIGPMLSKGLQLHLTGTIVSRPYIDLTLQLMRQFGASAEWTSERAIHVEPRPYERCPDYLVEADWSAASYWYAMVMLSPDAAAEVRLPGLFSESLQGDAAVADIFQQLGVSTTFVSAESAYGERAAEPIAVLRKNSVKPVRFDYDFVRQPDLAQTVVVACCMAGIPFRFEGLQSLKIKETDRIEALRAELAKLGFHVQQEQDRIMTWDGRRAVPLPDAAIDTYEDHRMAMAFAPACITDGSVRINDAHVVSKSYPGYWDDLARAGFTIQPQQK